MDTKDSYAKKPQVCVVYLSIHCIEAGGQAADLSTDRKSEIRTPRTLFVCPVYKGLGVTAFAARRNHV